MVLIHVPRPKNAYNPDRPVGSLLKSQVEHLREAETKLPPRYRHRIDTYTNAIKTEGEAAAYIRKVTEAIHAAHTDAERARRAARKRVPRRGEVIEIAAAATERTTQKRKSGKRKSARKAGARRSRRKLQSTSQTRSKPRVARKPRKK